MKHLKRFLIFSSILCLPVIFFSIYSNFLLDYSLDSLEFARQVTHQDPGEVSTLGRRVYHSVMKDLILEEAFTETVNYNSLILLALTARAFNESLDRQGYKRAEFYLTKIVNSKLPARHPLLRILDFLSLRFLRAYSAFMDYLKAYKGAEKQTKQQTFEYSGALLLTQAQISEDEGDLEKAVRLYREYLRFYSKSSERGFVQISISQILIRQQRLYEAENLLQDVKSEFKGQNEAEIGRRLLRKIEILKQRQNLVRELERLLSSPKTRKGPESEFLKIKLAVSYFSLHEFERSRKVLEVLTKSQEIQIRQKAQFYLTWIHKLRFEFDQSEKISLELLGDPLLEEQMRLGLRAGLADIYYQKRDIPQALAQYDTLSKEVQKEALERKAIYKSWTALSELEQGMIYFYDFANPQEAQRHLDFAKGFSDARPNSDFKFVLTSPDISLRDRAFDLLFQKHITLALELFLKYLERYPEDAWTHSGIATVYILMGDLVQAHRFAKKGYELGGDEYTASVLAYLYSLRQKNRPALVFYGEAVRRNSDYVIARFNLGCVYLELEKFKKALQVFEKLYQSVPMSKTMRVKVLNNIGYAYWGMGRQNKAIEKFKEAVALSSNFQTARGNLEQLSIQNKVE